MMKDKNGGYVSNPYLLDKINMKFYSYAATKEFGDAFGGRNSTLSAKRR